MRAGLDVDTDNGFADVAQGIKAGIAEFQAELVFTFCMESAVAFKTGGIFRKLALFAGVNFGMNFELDHKLPRRRMGTKRATSRFQETLN